MGRSFRKSKPLIYVFCEGESEQAYTEFLKEKFSDVASIRKPSSTGIFEVAEDKFDKDKRYKDNAEVIDEIWFFFDVEADDRSKWDNRLRIIKKLRRLKKKPGIRVRLLMTTACIEYWFMLHYKLYAPRIESVADKERVLGEVVQKEPHYKKGDYPSTARIAERYATAVSNADKILRNLQQEGLPCLEDSDERNRWLYLSSKTFSTVNEAISYLEQLR